MMMIMIIIVVVIIIIIIIITLYQALKTKYHEIKHYKQEQQKFGETLEHIIPSCPVLAKEQYIETHDAMYPHLHLDSCKEIWVKLDNEHWYEHVLESVAAVLEGKVTVLWKQQVQTNRSDPNIKPDIILLGNEEGICMLVGRNIIKREAEKILTRSSAHVECKIHNNRDDWNHINIIQTMPEQHAVRARNQGTTENSHIGHCTHTTESTYIKVQSIQHEK